MSTAAILTFAWLLVVLYVRSRVLRQIRRAERRRRRREMPIFLRGETNQQWAARLKRREKQSERIA